MLHAHIPCPLPRPCYRSKSPCCMPKLHVHAVCPCCMCIIDGQIHLVCCKLITFICFFINKRTNNKLLFVQSANGKRMKENHLGFRSPFDVSMSPCLHLHLSISPCLHVSMSMSRDFKFLKGIKELIENRKWQLLFVFCKQKTETANCFLQIEKQKMDICFPWSANDKRWSTMAFSANVPVYDVHAVCPCCIGPCCMNNWTCCMNTTRTLTLALALTLTHEHTNTRHINTRTHDQSWATEAM